MMKESNNTSSNSFISKKSNKDLMKELEEIFFFEKRICKSSNGFLYKVRPKRLSVVDNDDIGLSEASQAYCIKICNEILLSNTECQSLLKEVYLLEKLSHQNILKLISIYKLENNNRDIAVVYEYIDYNLAAIILNMPQLFKSQNNLFITDETLYIIYSIISAVDYIHSKNIIHRDLKPKNILINKDYQIKLCDFKLCTELIPTSDNPNFSVFICNDEEKKLTDYHSLRYYKSPEILLNGYNIGKPTDIWSLGCIIYEIIHAMVLFQGESTLEQLTLFMNFLHTYNENDVQELNSSLAEGFLKNIKVNTKKSHIKSYLFPSSEIENDNLLNFEEKSLKDLITKMLVMNPKLRITANEALNYSIFDKFKQEKTNLLVSSKENECLCKEPLLEISYELKKEIILYKEEAYNKNYKEKYNIK